MINRRQEDDQEWLITYTDIMAFLLGFFVLLFSSSKVDRAQYQSVVASLVRAVGGQRSMQVAAVPEPVAAPDQRRQVAESLGNFIHDSALGDVVSVHVTDRGVELSAQGELLFASGQAVLVERARPFLQGVADIIQHEDLRIDVEGHTDELPIVSKVYPSNWELSSTRAASVVRGLIECGIEPSLLTALGYAETLPTEVVDLNQPPHDQEIARAKNRRVVLVFSEQTR